MKKVVLGMSGGVDSSVAAYLLKEQGYDVIGVTMEIWQPDKVEVDGSCCGLSAVEDARSVANILGIPYYVLNFRKEFKESVIDYFIDDYLNGETPNPCIACNRYVKWESLLNKVFSLVLSILLQDITQRSKNIRQQVDILLKLLIQKLRTRLMLSTT